MRLIFKILMLLPILFALACSGSDGPFASNAVDSPETTVSEWLIQPVSSPAGQDDIEVPENLSPRDQIVRNCWIVQAAAEAFAAENGGQYPYNLADATPHGNTLIDLLPDGMLLVNPFWRARTEPCNGAAATDGQTGYVVNIYDGGRNGYTISGCGPNYKWTFYIVKEADGSVSSWIERNDL